MDQEQMIHWIGSGLGDPALVGGKAAGLDRLVRAGASVPPAFCLTTAAFHRYLEAHGLVSMVGERTAALPEESARADLAALIHMFPIPADLSEILHENVKTLRSRSPSSRQLAVRSSAVGEDALRASFAGQHESLRGVPSAEVEPALRACWASLWSPRAVTYRLQRGLGFEGMAMAVVVQAMVHADLSALVFTVNPVTGREDEMVVNASWGLGEGMLSGAITPDTFVLDKDTLQVRLAVAGEQPVFLVAREAGGTENVPSPGPTPALTEGALRTLGVLCRDLEAAFGMPLDLEAAMADGRWFFLQARPVTTRERPK